MGMVVARNYPSSDLRSASKDPAFVSQSSPSGAIRRLRDELLEEVARLERCLHEARLTLEPEPLAQAGSEPLLINESKVRRLLAARRIRERQLGEDLFADPAWDLLLEGFAADLGRRRVTVSELCQASNVPASVALRWLRKLEQDGWFIRPDSGDECETIELTAEGSVRLRRYFEVVGPTLFLV